MQLSFSDGMLNRFSKLAKLNFESRKFSVISSEIVTFPVICKLSQELNFFYSPNCELPQNTDCTNFKASFAFILNDSSPALYSTNQKKIITIISDFPFFVTLSRLQFKKMRKMFPVIRPACFCE